MRVYLGSDHAGFELKNHLVEHLQKQGHDVVDVGPHVYDPEDDYPAFCLHTGARVVADPGSLGVVIGGSGNGEQIAANKIAGVRSALVWKVEIAQLARQHNDSNVCGIGARAAHPGGGDRVRRRVPGHAVLRQRAAPAAHRPARRVRAHPRAAAAARLRPDPVSGRGAGPPAGIQLRRTMVRCASASARCSSVGRAASRARSAAPTLTCDEPEPTRPRSPRSASGRHRRRRPERPGRPGRADRPGRPAGWLRRPDPRQVGTGRPPHGRRRRRPPAAGRESARRTAGRSRRRRRSVSPIPANLPPDGPQNTSVGFGIRCQPNAVGRRGQRARGQLPDPPGRGERGQRGAAQVGRAQLEHGAGQVGRVVGRRCRSRRPGRRSAATGRCSAGSSGSVDVEHHVDVGRRTAGRPARRAGPRSGPTGRPAPGRRAGAARPPGAAAARPAASVPDGRGPGQVDGEQEPPQRRVRRRVGRPPPRGRGPSRPGRARPSSPLVRHSAYPVGPCGVVVHHAAQLGAAVAQRRQVGQHEPPPPVVAARPARSAPARTCS